MHLNRNVFIFVYEGQQLVHNNSFGIYVAIRSYSKFRFRLVHKQIPKNQLLEVLYEGGSHHLEILSCDRHRNSLNRK